MTKLDQYQYGAAVSEAPRVLVTAPPGSGKTTTLVAHLQFMVETRRITPSRIAAITFTRMAAREIRERAGEACRGMQISTLHAFCLDMLMTMGDHVGYERDWLSIIDDEDARLDEKEVLSDLGLIRRKPDGRYDWARVGAAAWQKFVSGVTSGRIERGSGLYRECWKAWDALLARFRSQNLLTYGTILTEALALLDDRKALAYFRDQHRHIVVDEAQDTSHIQWSIVWRLVEKAKPDTLWVVADADQSLYSWRGAAPNEIIAMSKSAKVETHTLTNSYRFGPGIADPAMRLIKNNAERIPSVIVPRGKMHGKCTTLLHQTIRQTADLVISLHRGRAPTDIAVLCRAHAPLNKLADEFKALKIKHVKIGRLNVLRSKAEFRAVMGYLRLAVNPFDRRAFMAITATEHLDESSIRLVREKAVAGRLSLPAAYGKTIPSDFNAIKSHICEIDPATDYSDAIDYLTRAAFWEGLVTPADFVRYVSLADMQDEFRHTNDGVTLCTGHAAKGLEWPVVVIIGCNESITPSKRAENEGNIEEERRIMYVMMTRAQEELILIHNVFDRDQKTFWFKNDGDPSRFIAEAKHAS